MTPIYLDYQATTPLDERILAKMLPYFINDFGNASSNDHEHGQAAQKAVKQATQQVAQLVGAYYRPSVHHPVIFTSGATESINLALQGFAKAHKKQPCRIGLMPIEHKAVLDTVRYLEKTGLAQLRWLKVDAQGRIDLEDLQAACRDGLDLLVAMAAHNEIGNIYPIETLGNIAAEYGTAFFCDASQAAGKIPLAFHDWHVSMMALTAHKMYGPKGVGALIVRKGLAIEPLIYGGGHQGGLRSGTLNVPGIVGLGEACHLRQQFMSQDESHISQLRDRLQNQLQESLAGLHITGDQQNRLAGNLHICIPNIQNDMLIANIRHQLSISRGAACSSGVEEPSHVLQALGLSRTLMEGALRISLGKETTQMDIDVATEVLIGHIQSVIRVGPTPCNAGIENGTNHEHVKM